jgi:hypothetical protein
MNELGFGFVRSAAITEAFGAESDRLCEVLAGLDDAAFARASGCPPWTVADLAYHVRMTIGRLPGMLDGREPAGLSLVSAAGYYRADQRFSDATNDDRIRSAQLPAAAGARLRADAGWDRVTLIAKLTGRCQATSAESTLIETHGSQRLALG